MDKIIRYVKKMLHKRRLYNLVNLLHSYAIIGENFATNIGAMICNLSGNRSHIILGNDCRMYGVIYCSTNGMIEIGNYTSIMEGVIFRCAEHIKIGSFCGIAEGTVISDNNNHPTDIEGRIKHRIRVSPTGRGYGLNSYGWELAESAAIVIGDGVWIGGNCTILKGVTIGDGAIVASASVVTKDVEPFSIVAGNPAKKVKQLPVPEVSVIELATRILAQSR